MRHPLRWLYRRLGPRYPRTILAIQFQGTYLVVLGGIGLLRVYQPMSAADFFLILAAALGLVLLENIVSLAVVFKLVAPGVRWLRGDRSPHATVAAWRALTGLPRDFFAYRRAGGGVPHPPPISPFLAPLLPPPGGPILPPVGRPAA